MTNVKKYLKSWRGNIRIYEASFLFLRMDVFQEDLGIFEIKYMKRWNINICENSTFDISNQTWKRRFYFQIDKFHPFERSPSFEIPPINGINY